MRSIVTIICIAVLTFLVLSPSWAFATPAKTEPEGGYQEVSYNVPVYVNDWTGEYTTDFETYYNASQVEVFGQNVFMTKQNFILTTSVFGAILGGIICFVLFKAVL